jgi:hypothetical protein
MIHGLGRISVTTNLSDRTEITLDKLVQRLIKFALQPTVFLPVQ